MSVLLGTPEDMDYACECCARVFAPPPAATRLRYRDRFTVLGLALRQALRHREGLRSAYRAIRPRHVARRNERAFEAFVTSFQLCSQCRGFICPGCWNGRQRICRGCVSVARLRVLERSAARLTLEEGDQRAGLGSQREAGASSGGRDAGGRGRSVRLLGPLMRPGRVRTVTSVAVAVFAWMLGAAEAISVMAAPH